MQTRPTASSAGLTQELARLVMGWRPAPGRYLKPSGGWVASSRFKPLSNLNDAFRLVEEAKATLALSLSAKGLCSVEVTVARMVGRATDVSVAAAITVAISRAMGLDLSGQDSPAPKERSIGRRGEERSR